MKTSTIKSLYQQYLVPVYPWNGIVIARGKGSWLWDSKGKRYLDFFAGWGVAALGHCHPKILQAVSKQSKLLLHVPNIFKTAPQAQLAQALVKASFPGKVFFANSGAEIVEAAIKLARAWGYPKKHEVITARGSFHGRTLGSLAATGQPKYQKGFRPLPAGFRHVPFNDLAALRKAIGRKTAAIMIEPIQGEGGVHVATKAYLQGVRKLCNQKKLLLIFDEVSTGMGRTGALFAYQNYQVTPDLLLLAKPIAGGLPLGAMVVRNRYADCWSKGAHATTFGGNPIVTAAGLAALQAIQSEGMLANVAKQSRFLFGELKKLQTRHPVIKTIRGKGHMVGLELSRNGTGLVEEALSRRLIINCTQDRVIRLYPALNITRKEMAWGLKQLEAALTAWENA